MQKLLPPPLRNSLLHPAQRGATLIEVLIAMLIMAIGLLGMASMTAASVQYNQLARMRGVGVSLVNDYAERARANAAGFDAGAYDNCAPDNGGACTRKYGAAAPAQPQPDTCALGTGVSNSACNSASALGAYDMGEWLYMLSRRLPGGDALVRTNFSAANAAEAVEMSAFKGSRRTADIWLMWTEPHRGADDNAITNAQSCPASVKGAGSKASDGLRCMFFRITL